MARPVFSVMGYIPGYSKLTLNKARVSVEAMVTDGTWRKEICCQMVSDAHNKTKVCGTCA